MRHTLTEIAKAVIRGFRITANTGKNGRIKHNNYGCKLQGEANA